MYAIIMRRSNFMFTISLPVGTVVKVSYQVGDMRKRKPTTLNCHWLNVNPLPLSTSNIERDRVFIVPRNSWLNGYFNLLNSRD